MSHSGHSSLSTKSRVGGGVSSRSGTPGTTSSTIMESSGAPGAPEVAGGTSSSTVISSVRWSVAVDGPVAGGAESSVPTLGGSGGVEVWEELCEASFSEGCGLRGSCSPPDGSLMRGDWLGRTGLDSADSASIGRTVVRVLLTLGALFAVFPKAWTLGVGVIGPVLVRARVDMRSVRRGPTTCGTGGDSEVGASCGGPSVQENYDNCVIWLLPQH